MDKLIIDSAYAILKELFDGKLTCEKVREVQDWLACDEFSGEKDVALRCIFDEIVRGS